MRFVYLHIPKNGGTSLHSIINNQYSSDEIFEIEQDDREGSKHSLLSLDAKSRERIKVVKGGHAFFGWHEYLPRPEEVKYYTILRNPMDRAQSFFYYAKRTERHYLFEELNKKDISFENFLQKPEWIHEISNGQTKMIAGITQREECTEKVFQKALSNLENKFFLVGIMEYYQESLFQLKEKLDWKSIVQEKKLNQNKNKDYNIPKLTENKLRAINQYDLILYEKYLQKFEQELKDIDLTKFELFINKGSRQTSFFDKLTSRIFK